MNLSSNWTIGTAPPALTIAYAGPSAPVATVPSIATVIKQVIASKRTTNRRENYVGQLQNMLVRFAMGREDLPIDQFSVDDLEGFLAGVPMGSRNSIISRLSALFSYAEKKGHIVINPVRRLDRATIDYKPPRILLPAEAEEMLQAAALHAAPLLPYLAVGLFTGVRPAEIDRLTWEQVDCSRSIIRIDAAASKVRRRRIVPMEPAARAWIEFSGPGSGSIAPPAKQRRLQLLAARLGMDSWPHDILRHSAASYLLALHRDAGKVAMTLGNSPGILLRHYHELVSAEDCQAFWALRPTGLKVPEQKRETCAVCGASFFPDSHKSKACPGECREKYKLAYNKLWSAANPELVSEHERQRRERARATAA